MTVNDYDFLDLRKKHDPSRGRTHRCGKKSMIPACVEPDDGGAGESPNAISFQPFTTGRGLEVVENVFGEVDHNYARTSMALRSSACFYTALEIERSIARDPDVEVTLVRGRDVWSAF